MTAQAVAWPRVSPPYDLLAGLREADAGDGELDELLLGIVPSEVMLEPSGAAHAIEERRAPRRCL